MNLKTRKGIYMKSFISLKHDFVLRAILPISMVLTCIGYTPTAYASSDYLEPQDIVSELYESFDFPLVEENVHENVNSFPDSPSVGPANDGNGFVEQAEEVVDTPIYPLDTTQYATPVAPGRYVIRPMMSLNRVLDISGGSYSSGANVQLYSSNMTLAQRFDVRYDQVTGLYTITNVASGLVLDVAGGHARSATNVWQYQPNNTPAQQWVIINDPKRPGAYVITSAVSIVSEAGQPGHGQFALDVSGASDRDGANVQIYALNGTAAQSFSFMPERPVVNAGNAAIADGFYKVTSALSSSMVLDISGASEANGAALQIYGANGTLAQSFYFKQQSDGFYTIHPACSGAAIDVSGANLVAGTRILQYAINNGDAQRWAAMDNGNGSVTFICKASGMAMDVSGASTAPGTPLLQWYPNGTNAQRFVLTPVTTNPIPEGYVTISPRSQPGKNLDIAYASRNDGANVQAYAANGTFAQKFVVKRLEPGIYAFQSANSGCYLTAESNNVIQRMGDSGTSGGIDEGVETGLINEPKANQKWSVTLGFGGFTIKSVATGQAMTLTTGGMDGYDIRLSTPSDSPAQFFKFSSTSLLPPTGVYTIISFGDFCLDKNWGSITNGTNVQVYTPNGTNAQKWLLEPARGEYFTIKCVQSGRALDISSGLTADKTNVQIWDYHGANWQLWKLVPSGDGWFYAQAGNGMYLTADPGNYSGNNVCVMRSVMGNAQKFRFETTQYAGYSGTYIDLNLSTQKVMVIRNGVVIFTCDVVTGATRSPTPTGTFYIMNKARNANLRGPTWNSWVEYWAQFTTTGCGFHDAYWQSSFGLARWQAGYGSHGCVNMNLSNAETFYNLVSVGDKVIVHY